ncbi:DNA cytosine methyltransferase, partial [Spirosoma utsteinense]|uniref:DNA cytosine methyltransferase n=1 Tax=Spirosoma utsteinense TaxID=2585773 RepID=UPI001645B99B
MRVIDLFAGCGGLSLGFKKAGFDVVAAFDHWKPAVDVYRANFDDHPIFDYDLGNVENYDDFKKYDSDIIIGGPPCQDFSSAGKRDENLGRGDLTLSYAHIINEVRPEWFLMENVARITKSTILRKAIEVYERAGYGLSANVLDASYCGVPQARKRFFLVGHLHSPNGFLDSYLSENRSAEPMTIHDYLGDSLELTHYYRHPRSYMRRGVFSVHEPSPTVRGVNRPIPKGYQRHSGDACGVESLRPLTTVERSYIQTFPKNFKFFGNKTELEQMIGNAVPVELAKFVAIA